MEIQFYVISPSFSSKIVLGIAGVFGTIFCVAVVKYIGKRNIFLISLSGAMISNVGLGLF